MNDVSINGRRIGAGFPVYVIAELSANHNHEMDQAVQLVHAAKDAGADAVKLQTYTPDTLTLRSEAEVFRVKKGSLWEGRTLYDLYSDAYMPWDWQPKLKEIADRIKIDLFSSPFDPTAVEFLERMGVPAYKIASFEIVDLPLIERVARTGKPMILSTGMATLEEIEEAVGAARRAGATQIVLLKCTSAYPAPAEEMHLRTIRHLGETLGVPVGLSDHTLGISVPVAGVALGACVVEKHFTLSRSRPGPDSAFSLEPAEFRAMTDAIRTAEKAMGKVSYGALGKEAENLMFRRSLFVVKPVHAGELFTAENVKSIRPAAGLHPRCLGEILGRRASRDIAEGTPLDWTLVQTP
ncbi:MAG TPA: pseudaminic acid synthase [Planctomycetota bacterium]|nr:pseudaminic acid synthase [Planctomycetota bacterium]